MKMNIWIGSALIAFSTTFGGLQASTSVTIDQVLNSGPAITAALVEDELVRAQNAAVTVTDFASKWLLDNPSDPLATEVTKMKVAAEKLTASEDLDEARIAFIALNQGAIAIIRSDKALQSKWQLFFCPMVAKKQGFWVQPKGEELTNPYMGTTMPGCGSKKAW